MFVMCMCMSLLMLFFFFSSRRRHTRCALVTGVQTCALPIWRKSDERLANCDFPWIADNKKELADALGIIAKDAGVAYRATFIVDPHNVIQHVTVNGLDQGRNPQETLRVLDALQSDEQIGRAHV